MDVSANSSGYVAVVVKWLTDIVVLQYIYLEVDSVIASTGYSLNSSQTST